MSNADVTFPCGSIRRLSRFLSAHTAIGVLGAQQVYPDGSWQRSWGALIGIREALLEALGVTSLMSGLRRAMWPRRLDRRARDVGYVDGAVMAIRRQAFDSIGGFEGMFSFSSEDSDFCLRARRAGWQVAVLPTVDVVHRRGGSSDRLDWSVERKTAAYLSGTRTFLERNRGPFFANLYLVIKLICSFRLHGHLHHFCCGLHPAAAATVT